jgi:aldose 1-epimerase
MTPSISLASGALRCELAPALGGCIAGLWLGGQQVLRSTPAAELQSVQVSGSYPLVPYSNRIGYRKLHWAGRDYELPENFAPEPHTIHGVGWERSWVLEEASNTRCVLGYRHAADASWPFAFDSLQTFTLSDDALEMQISVTNCAGVAAPFGLGWHPYFAKSENTHIRFIAAGRWEMGADKLPTLRSANAGLDTDCSNLNVDHCFDGWNGRVQLIEAGLQVTVTSDLNCLVVFTTQQRDSIAIEPVSHVNNALALGRQSGQSCESLGMRVLQPDETFSARMRIQVETAV